MRSSPRTTQASAAPTRFKVVLRGVPDVHRKWRILDGLDKWGCAREMFPNTYRVACSGADVDLWFGPEAGKDGDTGQWVVLVMSTSLAAAEYVHRGLTTELASLVVPEVVPEVAPDEPPTSEFRFDGIIYSNAPGRTLILRSAGTRHTAAKEMT